MGTVLQYFLNVNQSGSLEGNEIYTAQPDIPDPSLVELAIEKLKRNKATGVDHIPSELIQAGGAKLYEGYQNNRKKGRCVIKCL